MSTTININIAASDNGTLNQVGKNASNARKELEGATLAADKLAAATRSASQTRAVASASGSNKRSAMDDSGLNRGTAGGNARGDSRDFARQAQGLGGLVHIYATFAANIFAVSAAFNALSKAADITNMVEGLNQLGAASGKNLGSMAKHVADLTEGAVSLKDAMAATAQATAAGMSGEQLNRMTKVAKNASQALGRDMTDALSRLSRGVTKIEPELLDELGIMVKVDKANRDYALSLGKTVTSLTDFERRQAFANAVIEQGEKKFGAIKIDANPYQQLQASFINLLVTGGELINKVLGPVAKLLAESPTALGAVMAGVAGMLLSKAIPALTQWREGLDQAAHNAAKRYKEIAQAHESFMANRIAAAGDAEQSAIKSSINNRIAAVQGALAKALPETSKLIKAAVSDSFMVDEKSIDKNLKNYNTAVTNALKQVGSTEALINAEKAKGAAQDKDMVVALEKRLQIEKENVAQLKIAVAETRLLKQETQQLAVASAKNAADIAKKAGPLTQEAALARKAAAAERASIKASVYSAASSDATSMGVAQAWANAKKSIDESSEKLGKVQTITTKASAGIRILGTAFMNIVSSLGQFGMAVAMAIGLVEGAIELFSKNRKEIEELGKAFDLATSSVEGTQRTLDRLSKLDPLERLSPENITAKANALLEVSNSLENVSKSFDAVVKNQNGFDIGLNFIKGMFGKSEIDAVVKSSVKTIFTSLNTASEGPEKEKFRKTLMDTLKITSTDTKSLTEGLDKLRDLSGEQIAGALLKISEANKTMAQEAAVAASKIEGLNSAFEKTTKQFDTLMMSFAPSDNISKLGMEFVSLGSSMSKALEQPEKALARLVKVASNPEELKLFSPDIAANLLSSSAAMKSLETDISHTETLLREMEKTLDDMNKQGMYTKNYAAVKKYEEGISDAKQELIRLKEEATKYAETIGKALSEDAFKKGIAFLKANTSKVLADAQIAMQKAVIAPLAGTEIGIKLNADLDKRGISVQEALLQQQKDLIISQERSRAATEALTIATRIETLERKADKGPLNEKDSTELKTLDTSKDQLDQYIKFIGKANISSKELLQEVEKLGPAYGEQATKFAASLSGLSAQLGALGLQKVAIDIKAAYDTIEAQQKDRLKTKDTELSIINTELKLLGTYKGEYNSIIENEKDSLLTKKASLEIEKETIVTSKMREANALALEKIKKRGNLSEEDYNKTEEQLAKNLSDQEQKLANLKIEKETERAELVISNKAKEFAMEEKLLDIRNKIKDTEDSIILAQLKLQKQKIDIGIDKGDITPNQAIDQKYKIDLREREIAYEKELRSLEQATKAEEHRLEIMEMQISAIYDQAEAYAYTLKEDERNVRVLEIDVKRQQVAEKFKQQRQDSLRLLEAQKTAAQQIYDIDLQSLALAKDKAIYDQNVKPFTEGIANALKAGLEDGFTNGAASGAKTLISTLRANLRKAVFQVIVDPAINSLKGGITDTLTSLVKGDSAGVNGGLSSILSGFSTPFVNAGGVIEGVGTALGSEFITSFGVEFAAGAKAGMGIAMQGTSFAGVLGAAAPWVLGLMALNSLAKSLDKGETRSGQTVGYGQDLTSNKNWGTTTVKAHGPSGGSIAEEQINTSVNSTVAGINQLLLRLGSAEKVVGFKGGLETSDKGRGGVFSGGMLASGARFGEQGTGSNYDGTYYEKTSAQSGNAELMIKNFSTDLIQASIQAIQAASDIPKQVKNFVQNIDTESLANEQAAAVLGIIAAIGDGINKPGGISDSVNNFLGKVGDSVATMSADTLASVGSAISSGALDVILSLDKYKTALLDTGTVDSILNEVKQLGPNFGQFASLMQLIGKDVNDAYVLASRFGTDAMSSAVATYYDKFYTSEEKLAKAGEALNKAFKDIGVTTIPKTHAEFRKLVEGLDLTKAAEQEQYAALMKLAPAFDAYTEQLGEGTKKIWQSMKDIDFKEVFSSVGSSIESGIMEALQNNTDIGASVGETLSQNIRMGLAQTFAAQISSVITDTIVTPLISQILISGTMINLADQAVVDGLIATAEQKINAITQVFNGLLESGIIDRLVTTVTNAVSSINGQINFGLKTNTASAPTQGSYTNPMQVVQVDYTNAYQAIQNLKDDIASIYKELNKVSEDSTIEKQRKELEAKKAEYVKRLTESGALDMGAYNEYNRLMEGYALYTNKANDYQQNFDKYVKELMDQGASYEDAAAQIGFYATFSREWAGDWYRSAQRYKEAAGLAGETLSLIDDMVEKQKQLNALKNKQAADDKTKSIEDRIFELTHTEEEVRLKNLDKQKQDYIAFYKDLGQVDANGNLPANIQAVIDQWYALEAAAKGTTGAISEMEQKRFDLDQKIYELTGRSIIAKEKQRQKELEAMDEGLRPIQQYIYSLEDLTDAYQKAHDRLTEIIDGINSSLQTLKDYRMSLKTGQNTTLNPTDRYNLLKQQLADVAAIARSNPVDDAGRKAQQDAISKLPSIGDAFLEASRTLFASGAQYTTDFNSVLAIIDSTESSLVTQLDVANQQLDVLRAAESKLGIINETLVSTQTLINNVTEALNRVNTDVVAAISAGSQAAGAPAPAANTATNPTAAQPTLSANESLVSSLYSTYLNRTADAAGMTYWKGLLDSGQLTSSTIEAAFKPEAYKELVTNLYSDVLKRQAADPEKMYWVNLLNTGALSTSTLRPEFIRAATPELLQRGMAVPTYAAGGLAHGLSLVGEEGPELVNFDKPGMVYTAGQTMNIMSDTNKELLDEIKALRAEVARLREEQIKHTGSLITSNYDSANRVAQTLVEAVGDVSSEIAWAERSKVKVS